MESPAKPILISIEQPILLSDHQKELLGKNKKQQKMKDVLEIQEIYGRYNAKTDTVVREVIGKIKQMQKEALAIAAHPYKKEIEEWKLDTKIFFPSNSPEDKEATYYFVDDASTFQFMMKDLLSQRIVFVDSEETENITCLIQISTKSNNYVVDCLLLLNEVVEDLKTVLEDPQILKVLYSCENDIRSIHRDFQICMWPVLDLQIVHKHIPHQSKQSTGFADLVIEYTSISISKEEKRLGQLSDYRKRPLHENLRRYATRDSYLLKLAWQGMVEKHGVESVTTTEIQQDCKNVAKENLYSIKTNQERREKNNSNRKPQLRGQDYKEHFPPLESPSAKDSRDNHNNNYEGKGHRGIYGRTNNAIGSSTSKVGNNNP